MAWLAVDRDCSEYIYKKQPTRVGDMCWGSTYGYAHMSHGSIEKLIGRKLTWDDEPVEI